MDAEDQKRAATDSKLLDSVSEAEVVAKKWAAKNHNYTVNNPKKYNEKDPFVDTRKAADSLQACAAFVTFNYNESMARCVEDFAFYKYLPPGLYPRLHTPLHPIYTPL